MSKTGSVLLLAGPAGAGKSTLAEAWAASRPLAAHVEVDKISEMITQGRIDPRDVADPGQSEQWETSVRATCALVRAFAERGVDVAVDDVLTPGPAEALWRPLLSGLPKILIVVLPTLDTCLARGTARPDKLVPEHLVRLQHDESATWPPHRHLDTTGESVETSARRLLHRAASCEAAWD
ncbi:AAA family ATPase [Pseudonocardia xinjiangensis]|uniref:AAA family ATPase n=1 Tax=Pseudonocardia xinjiangensis TaxID=75289 RepID=UPI003D93ADAF